MKEFFNSRELYLSLFSTDSNYLDNIEYLDIYGEELFCLYRYIYIWPYEPLLHILDSYKFEL